MAFKEPLEHTDYKLAARSGLGGTDWVILVDGDGEPEFWFRNDGHASYGIVIDGHDYEFARAANEQDLIGAEIILPRVFRRAS